MDIKKVQNLLKSVWTICNGHEEVLGSPDCTKYATIQLGETIKITKKIKAKGLVGSSFSYDKEEFSVEGHYCMNCASIRLEFVNQTLDLQMWKLRPIPGIEEAIKIMNIE